MWTHEAAIAGVCGLPWEVAASTGLLQLPVCPPSKPISFAPLGRELLEGGACLSPALLPPRGTLSFCGLSFGGPRPPAALWLRAQPLNPDGGSSPCSPDLGQVASVSQLLSLENGATVR